MVNKLKVAELENNWKRALADYKNLEQRYQTQKADWIKFAALELVLKLLPVLDDLNLALQHRPDNGIKLIGDKLSRIIKEQGLIEIETTGGDFNPTEMECAQIVSGAKNKVVKTVLPGYRLYDRIVRPARVEVGSGEI